MTIYLSPGVAALTFVRYVNAVDLTTLWLGAQVATIVGLVGGCAAWGLR